MKILSHVSRARIVLSPGASLGMIAALLAFAPAVGNAQACAMLSPGAPPIGAPADPLVRDGASSAVISTLRESGVSVLENQAAQEQMAELPFQGCDSLECGGLVSDHLGVDFVVLITVWAPRGTPTSVVVSLISSENMVAGDAPVADGDAAAAALAALVTAQQRWQAWRTGYLRVSSVPPGAVVMLDGRSLGQTPLRHLVNAGAHAVRVFLDGFEPVERSVEVEPGQEVPLELTLEAVVSGPPADSTGGSTGGSTEPHFTNWLVGAGLLAGGVALLISPFHTIARDGECETFTADARFCTARITFGADTAVLMALGFTALVGGTIFLVSQPIRVSVSVSPQSASLTLSGTY